MKKRNKANEAERGKKTDAIRKLEIDQMAEHEPSESASRWLKRPAYSAMNMIRAQGEQMQRETAEKWLKRKSVKMEEEKCRQA